MKFLERENWNKYINVYNLVWKQDIFLDPGIFHYKSLEL